MGVQPAIVVSGILLFAAASFFFALAEAALFALGKWQARLLAERVPQQGGLVLTLLKDPPELLATIVLGNTLANAAIVGLGLHQVLVLDWPILPTVFSLLALILLGCEVLPKTLAVRAPGKWSLRVARPMAALQRLGRPLLGLVRRVNQAILRRIIPKSVQPHTTLTDAEYQELLELAYQQGTLAKTEKEIILQIISLDQKTAKDVMKPRPQMDCISDELTVEQMREAARRFKHRRLPIYDETPDTIVGVLNAQALLLNPEMELEDAIELPSFVPETMNLLQLLKSLQLQQRGLAIVLDEYGGTDGLVTIEDILEEVVGDIRGEGEPEGFVMEKLGAGRWRVNGTMRLDDFQREYPQLGDVPEVDTMGGLLVSQLEVVPTPGQSVVFRGLRLTARVADERRVRELLVEETRKR